MRVVLASANPDKAKEIIEIVGPLGVEVLPRPSSVPDVEETADTLEGNARLKATAIATAAGLPALADDTGLEVDFLGRAPGVHTARYAGVDATYADNVALLLESLKAVPPSSELRASSPSRWCAGRMGERCVAEGFVRGHIALEPLGERGFGYDPVFIPDEGDGRTFAEMSDAEKHELSHRGRALRALAAELVASARLTSPAGRSPRCRSRRHRSRCAPARAVPSSGRRARGAP